MRFVVGLILTCVGGGPGGVGGAACVAQTANEAMVADLKFLAGEALRGRSAIEPEIDVAADYVAERFAQAGLQTELYDNTPFQPLKISVGSRPTDPANNFLLVDWSDAGGEETPAGEVPAGEAAPGGEQRLVWGENFSPMAIGATEATAQGELVWVGYGIHAPEHGYDDYAGIAVAGKIVVMLRKEPGMDDPASPFNGVRNSRHAFFDTKVALAIDQGAVGVLLVNDPASVERAVEAVQATKTAEVKRLASLRKTLAGLPEEAVNSRERLNQQVVRIEGILEGLEDEIARTRQGVLDVATAGTQPRPGREERLDPETGQRSPGEPIPVASIPRPVADAWLKSFARPVDRSPAAAKIFAGGLSAVEKAIDRDGRPYSATMPVAEATLTVQMTPATAMSKNVLGVIPGRGELAEQTIVIGAHYDHVGMGGYGSLAPGTVAVHNGADDNASGTATLIQVARQLVPQLASLASHRRVVFIAFTGEERGLLGSKHYVRQPRYPLSETVAMINMDMVGRLRDNELTVYGTGSAAVMDEVLDDANATFGFELFRVASGYGPSDHSSFYEQGIPVLFFFTGLHQDYHRPSDDFNKLNLAGMTRITDMICQVTERLATMPQRPVYASTTDRLTIRRQLTVFLGVSMAQRDGYVLLSGIGEESPAQRAGLREGDRLVSLGESPIVHVEEVMEALRQRLPGDNLSVTVLRDGQQWTHTARLRER